MTYTYTPGGDTTIDKVRFRIGDTKENTGLETGGSGPRPDKTNYADEEITQMFTDEGDRLPATIAAMFEVLSAEWSAWATEQEQDKLKLRSEQVADNFRKEAKKWRGKIDGGELESSSGFAYIIRVNDYPDLIA